jgi:hypothetical protein
LTSSTLISFFTIGVGIAEGLGAGKLTVGFSEKVSTFSWLLMVVADEVVSTGDGAELVLSGTVTGIEIGSLPTNLIGSLISDDVRDDEFTCLQKEIDGLTRGEGEPILCNLASVDIDVKSFIISRSIHQLCRNDQIVRILIFIQHRLRDLSSLVDHFVGDWLSDLQEQMLDIVSRDGGCLASGTL